MKKFDYSLKKQLLNSRKVYTIDSAFCNRLGFQFSENKGRVLETIIYLHLLRMNLEVFYHSGKKECDFIIREGLQIKAAVQVVYELNDVNVSREVEGLLEAIITYKLGKGFLLVLDNQVKRQEIPDTIEVIPAWKWVLENGFQNHG